MNRPFPVPPGAVAADLHPIGATAKLVKKPGRWQALCNSPLVSLCEAPETWVPGWVLVRGFIHAELREATFLHIERANGARTTIKAPVTARGKIQEAIWLPPDSIRLSLQPISCEGEFELSGVTVQPLGRLDSMLRRAWRVRKTQKKYPRHVLHALGWPRPVPWLNLARAYQIANTLRDHLPHTSYAQYIAATDSLTREDRKRIARHIRRFPYRPSFRIVLANSQADETSVLATLTSLQQQLYGNFRVEAEAPLPVEDASGEGRWLSAGSSYSQALAPEEEDPPEWFIFLRPGECLADYALYWLAAESLAHPEAEFIYSDHDHLGGVDQQRHSPIFKPDWSPELLRSANYIGPAAAVRQDALERIGMPAPTRTDRRHDLWLRAALNIPDGAVRHVPAVLWHLPDHPSPHLLAAQADLEAVRRHLDAAGVAAEVRLSRLQRCHIRYVLPNPPPKVSIIVPTRDGLHYLRPCIESVLNRTSYPNIEVLIVDNDSQQPATLSYLQAIARDSRVQIVRDASPFNYSALNNRAARLASGSALCLLNNDTEVITGDWLEEMVGHLVQPRVGVVGAKLYYGDGRVQHAGDAVGPGGCADHYHSKIGHDEPGYAGRAILAQDLSAVTGACLLTWKDLYFELGGLNEKDLPVSFNDVDYCLRARQIGRRVIWTPHAELFHYESLTRGAEVTTTQQAQGRQEADYMRTRWAAIMKNEPFYNPNLSYDRPDFTLNPAPLMRRPWESH